MIIMSFVAIIFILFKLYLIQHHYNIQLIHIVAIFVYITEILSVVACDIRSFWYSMIWWIKLDLSMFAFLCAKNLRILRIQTWSVLHRMSICILWCILQLSKLSRNIFENGSRHSHTFPTILELHSIIEKLKQQRNPMMNSKKKTKKIKKYIAK